MKRKTIMTLVASAALCLTMLPGPVSARMGGGMHGGMGMHGAGFGGGMRAGVRSAPVAFHAGHFGNSFAFRHRVFIHDRFAFRHHRFRHFPHSFFVASIGDDCFVVRQVWTPWGWRWRRAWVCGWGKRISDAGDARWSEFRVWQDANGDGISLPGEVKTREQLGIASIDLNPKGPATTFGDGSMIQGLSTFTRTDGTTGAAGDVALAYEGADTSLSQLIQAVATYSAASSGLGAGSFARSANDSSQQGTVAASWHP